MSGITLYYDLLSQPSRAVYLFLKANKIPFTEHPLELMKGEHKQKAYLDVNPQGQVPAVKVDGACVSECSAILKYLAKLKKKTDWVGKSLIDEARVDQFLSWQQSGMRAKCIAVFVPTLKNKMTYGFFTQEPIDPEEAKKAKEALDVAITALENNYLTVNKKKVKFIGGDHISVADLVAYCELYQLHAVCEDDCYKKNKRVAQWAKDVETEIEKLGGKGTLEAANKSINELRKLYEAADGAKK